MKSVDCLYIAPPGDLWIRFEDGETRKATELESKFVLQVAPDMPSEIHWQGSPAQSRGRTPKLAV